MKMLGMFAAAAFAALVASGQWGGHEWWRVSMLLNLAGLEIIALDEMISKGQGFDFDSTFDAVLDFGWAAFAVAYGLLGSIVVVAMASIRGGI